MTTFMKTSPFIVSANGPDLAAARALPPASSLQNTMAAVMPYARQGVEPEVQERLVGLSRRLPATDLREVLTCARREEPMIFSAAIDSLPMGGPTSAYVAPRTGADVTASMSRAAALRSPAPPRVQ